jgi:predicted peptidase
MLGPGLPREMVARIVDPRQMDVPSFGTDYEVRLPADPGGWSIDVPSAEKPCFVLSPQGLYLRANFDANPAGFKACYVDMKDGRILASSKRIDSELLIPRGISGYATEWALLTKESEPRAILSYPAQKI